jgi:hypothetical protein
VDDLWEKSKPNTEVLPTSNSNSINSWDYKEDEVDEAVLSELPKEIQQELRNKLRLKRRKTGGKSTINNFFKRNSSTANERK